MHTETKLQSINLIPCPETVLPRVDRGCCMKMQEGDEQTRQQDQAEFSIRMHEYQRHDLWWRTDQTTRSMLSSYNRYLVNEQKEILISYPTALLGYPTRLKPKWSSIKGLLAEQDHSWVSPYKRCLHHPPCRRYLQLHSVMQNFLEQQTFTSVELCHHYTPVKTSSSPGQSLLRSPPTASLSKSYLDHRIWSCSIFFSFFFFSPDLHLGSCMVRPPPYRLQVRTKAPS